MNLTEEEIKEIAKQGVIRALMDRVDERIYDLERTFRNFKNEGVYTNLGEKCSVAREIINDVERLLLEVQKIDGVSK